MLLVSKNDVAMVTIYPKYGVKLFFSGGIYDFVSILYKKKMNATDVKYLSKTTVSMEEEGNQKGQPANQRYPFRK